MLTSVDRPKKVLLPALVYVGLIAAAVLAFLAVNAFGAGSQNLTVSAAQVVRHSVPETLTHLLLAMSAILLASSALGALCRWLHQPAVVGEILAGICLGPSVLGALAPSVQRYVLPAEVAPQLGMFSQIGVILFMFLIGLELDTALMRSHSRATLAISHASIVVPFVLGSIASIWLFPALAPPGVTFTVFALFVGISLSVTAFPVLARILTDTRLSESPMGVMALTCAAVDDVTAWCLLALIVGIAKASAWDAVITCGATLVYVLAVLIFVRPPVGRWARAQAEHAGFSRRAVPAVLLALLLSALVTELIGIHAIFGAFLLGAIIPHDTWLARELRHRFHDLVLVLFMPAFFAFTGMRTQIALVSGLSQWLACGAIILIACLGKFGGSYAAARLVGLKSRDAASIGILMNTRGLMELVVLNLGLDLGVISPTLFAMMVIMALVTTFLSSPLLRLTNRAALQRSSRASGPVFRGAAGDVKSQPSP